MMDPFFIASLDANREIATYISGGLNNIDRDKGSEGAGGDISSGIDLVAEEIFARHLSSFGLIESEESGTIGSGDDTIIIDPIDGSSNILSNFPYYGTSVALLDSNGVAKKGVIANLATGDIFFKEMNSKPLCGKFDEVIFEEYISKTKPEIGIFEKAYAHPGIVSKLNDEHMKFRAPGAVALSLVYARDALFFLYVGEQRSYDFAAGILFCEDLEVIVKDEYVIVSKDKRTIEKIEHMVVSQRGV